MAFQAVCDAWMLELQTSVPELAEATPHLYASWSSNAIADSTPGRHIAVWPEGDPEVAQGALAGTPPADEVTTSYQVAVWEGATAEMTRVFDSDEANADWLALYETVKARFYVLTNQALGDPGSGLRYRGGLFDRAGDKRFFAIRFTKRAYRSFT